MGRRLKSAGMASSADNALIGILGYRRTTGVYEQRCVFAGATLRRARCSQA